MYFFEYPIGIILPLTMPLFARLKTIAEVFEGIVDKSTDQGRDEKDQMFCWKLNIDSFNITRSK